MRKHRKEEIFIREGRFQLQIHKDGHEVQGHEVYGNVCDIGKTYIQLLRSRISRKIHRNDKEDNNNSLNGIRDGFIHQNHHRSNFPVDN